MNWVLDVLTSAGTAVVVNVAMEAYYQRRASDKVFDYDLPGEHRAES